MKKSILLLLISTGFIFTAELPTAMFVDLADQVKWRGPKSEQGLNNKILVHSIRTNFPGFCCCIGNFEVQKSAEDYLKQHVLHLKGVPLAQSPYCKDIYAAVAQKHGLVFSSGNPTLGPLFLFAMTNCFGAMSLAETHLDASLTIQEKISILGLTFYSAFFLTSGVCFIPCIHGSCIRKLRLRGNLDAIPDADESKKYL